MDIILELIATIQSQIISYELEHPFKGEGTDSDISDEKFYNFISDKYKDVKGDIFVYLVNGMNIDFESYQGGTNAAVTNIQDKIENILFFDHNETHREHFKNNTVFEVIGRDSYKKYGKYKDVEIEYDRIENDNTQIGPTRTPSGKINLSGSIYYAPAHYKANLTRVFIEKDNKKVVFEGVFHLLGYNFKHRTNDHTVEKFINSFISHRIIIQEFINKAIADPNNTHIIAIPKIPGDIFGGLPLVIYAIKFAIIEGIEYMKKKNVTNCRIINMCPKINNKKIFEEYKLDKLISFDQIFEDSTWISMQFNELIDKLDNISAGRSEKLKMVIVSAKKDLHIIIIDTKKNEGEDFT